MHSPCLPIMGLGTDIAVFKKLTIGIGARFTSSQFKYDGETVTINYKSPVSKNYEAEQKSGRLKAIFYTLSLSYKF